MRNHIVLPIALMLLSFGSCCYGLANGSLLSLPYPDPPPPEILAAARARERVGDIVALIGAVVFTLSALWLIVRRRHVRQS